jgi:hypothetical protein
VQTDALLSWKNLKPKPEIIIIGNDPGTAEICKKHGFIHVTDVKCSSTGTPICIDFIRQAEKRASNDIMLLCSGDIYITQDTIEAAKAISKEKDEFCVVPRKKFVDIENGKVVRDVICGTGTPWATWQGGDYWLHSKGIFEGMPDFLIGRHYLERWMYRWLCNKDALIDGTLAITCLHQKHPHEMRDGHGEVKFNYQLYQDHKFHVEKWKDKEFYKRSPDGMLINIGINHSNYIMQSDFTLIDNDDPRRQNFKK